MIFIHVFIDISTYLTSSGFSLSYIELSLSKTFSLWIQTPVKQYVCTMKHLKIINYLKLYIFYEEFKIEENREYIYGKVSLMN